MRIRSYKKSQHRWMYRMRRSRLIRNWLCYGLLWLFCFVLWQSVDGYLYYLFVIAFSMLPILSLCLAIFAYYRFHLSLQEDKLQLPAILFWLCSGIEITIQKHHIFYGLDAEEVLVLTKGQTQLSCDYAGIWDISVKRIRIQDLLGLFWLHPHGQTSWTAQVLWKEVSLPEEIKRRFALYLESQKEEEHLPSGDYEVRTYRQGDSLHHIHYKISSKFQTLMVKEYEEEKAEAPAVFLVFPQDMDACDQYLRVVYALCLSYVPLRLFWSGEDGLCSQDLGTKEQVPSAFVHLFQTPKQSVRSIRSAEALIPLDEEVLYG